MTARGMWSRWECDRPGCGAGKTTRGEQHQDKAEWDAVAHQQLEHREMVIRDALAALGDARAALALAWAELPDVHVSDPLELVRVSPFAGMSALGVWEAVLRCQLPEPADTEGQVQRSVDRQLVERRAFADRRGLSTGPVGESGSE